VPAPIGLHLKNTVRVVLNETYKAFYMQKSFQVIGHSDFDQLSTQYYDQNDDGAMFTALYMTITKTSLIIKVLSGEFRFSSW
jgi:hypothetical protein